MAVFNFSIDQLQMFFLVFLRVGAIMFTVPVFDSRSIPAIFKAGLAVAVSLVLFPVLNPLELPPARGVIPFALGVVGEIAMGVTIGLSVKLIFAGIQLAGQMAGFQMGFAIVNVMDPVTSDQVSIIAQLKNLMAMLMFITINAHHWFLRAIVDSFRLVPPFGFQLSNSLADHIIRLGCNMFIIAVKVGAPVMAALLLTSAALGLIARTVPQMQIFIVAMPLKIIVGLMFLAFSLPVISWFLRHVFDGLGNDILTLLKAI